MLHIVNSTPAQTSALNGCLLRLMPESALLLIENGVYAAINNDKNSALWKQLPEMVELFVLKNDLEARGVRKEEINPRFCLIDYAEFVDLVERYPSAQSWF